jgi:hypothetical protein
VVADRATVEEFVLHLRGQLRCRRLRQVADVQRPRIVGSVQKRTERLRVVVHIRRHVIGSVRTDRVFVSGTVLARYAPHLELTLLRDLDLLILRVCCFQPLRVAAPTVALESEFAFDDRIGLGGTELARATCGTIRLKLLKIGALMTTSVRRVKIAFASSCPYQAIFAHAHRRRR